MKLFLDNPVFAPSFKIKHTDRLFFIGSCFADTMSHYFINRKYSVLQNPFGVLYNPISIAECIEHIANGVTYNTNDFYLQTGLYSSWDHHSNLAMPNANDLKSKLDLLNQSSLKFLKESNVMFVTLGTAWAFYHKEKERVVANNHRAPADSFEKKLLSIDQIENALIGIIQSLKQINSSINVVFTVSPVRHSRQGLAENNRSKARLLEAVHSACEQEKNCIYFPSYELVQDVLRDYRFFEKDLVHPNAMATDYVWDYLLEHLIDKQDYGLLNELYNLHLATLHKVRHQKGLATNTFANEQLAKIDKLMAENQYLRLEEERGYFKSL